MQCGSVRLRMTGCFRSLAGNLRFYSVGRFEKIEKIKRKKKPPSALPPHLNALMKEWPKTLEEEVKAQTEALSEYLKECDNNWAELESRGLGLGDLTYEKIHYDPIEGAILELIRPQRDAALGYMKSFRSGVPVVLCDGNSLNKLVECIIKWTSFDKISLRIMNLNQITRFEKSEAGAKFAIIPSIEKGSIQSLQSFLENKTFDDKPGRRLLDYAFRAKVMPSIHNDPRRSGDCPENFNSTQRLAVNCALNNKRPFLCIQGPPGTGKTKVLAEIVRQLKEKKKKVLVLAPTHVAVNNALKYTKEAILRDKIKQSRLAIFDFDNERTDRYRLQPEDEDDICHADTLDEAIKNNPKYSMLKEGSEDLHNDDSENSVSKAERKKRVNDWKRMKDAILMEVYREQQVIFCTLSSSTVRKLSKFGWHPDIIVIDEAAQCTEPATWAAIIHAPRCILVGDFQQLPTIVISKAAIEKKLHVSLMERLIMEFSNCNIRVLLDRQYRMNEKIMQWSSEHFYDGLLKAGESVKDQRLSDICQMPENHSLNEPLIMLNTALMKDDKNTNKLAEKTVRKSRINYAEARLVVQYYNILCSVGVNLEDIAIITPYYEQVMLIRAMINNRLVRVHSVDAFQGQENEVVIFSMVRHNENRALGFLAEERRMNVAVTRAKRQFVLIGSSWMMSRDKNLKSLYKTIQTTGKIYDPNDLNSYAIELQDHLDKVARELR
ncbi:hypothetical protein WR25_23761 isoform A [Diploscapter pachys]|uniref:Helicase ATP-binding domain-containing protein n=1 Tax=Diploscapter pachys TaxID=2018661 RepID=A0A2A2JFP8_9BILA|nr:hypothetical protein WR25_23761 isoform A [Diploscapter pachys]